MGVGYSPGPKYADNVKIAFKHLTEEETSQLKEKAHDRASKPFTDRFTITSLLAYKEYKLDFQAKQQRSSPKHTYAPEILGKKHRETFFP